MREIRGHGFVNGSQSTCKVFVVDFYKWKWKGMQTQDRNRLNSIACSRADINVMVLATLLVRKLSRKFGRASSQATNTSFPDIEPTSA